jgi:VCBS repeat-containing protein
MSRTRGAAARTHTPGAAFVPRPRTPFLRRPIIEELEARLLLSADPTPAALIGDTVYATPIAAEFRAITDVGAPRIEFAPVAQDAVQRTREIVFVDASTPDFRKLIDDIRANASDTRDIEVVALYGGGDGIEQITSVLAKRKGIDAIHVISHGSPGEVQLGTATLDFDSLVKQSKDIKKWGRALGENGDILFYGCDLAANESGKSLMQAIARLTGADVAASEDLTGSAALGGDWDLEFEAGFVESALAVSLGTQRTYEHVLAPGITVVPPGTATTTESGGTAAFTVVLNQAPTANVSIGIATSDISEGTPSVATLTFTTANWNVAQSVTVTGANDARIDGNIAYTIITAAAVSADAGYNGLNAADVALVNLDDERVQTGVMALYLFEEGTGTTVRDLSGYGAPLDLTISDPGTASVDWIAGGLNVFGPDSNTIISSGVDATKIRTGAQATNELTMEAWVRPVNNTQNGPARLFTMSSDTGSRDFQLAQQAGQWNARVRTNNGNGAPDINAGTVTAGALTHVVLTHDALGNERLYVNGVQVHSGNRPGDFAGWADFQLHMFNEQTLDRQWLGEQHLIAIYNRALTAGEVGVNFAAGANGPTELVVDTAVDNNDGTTTSIAALLANKGADGRISLREAMLAARNTAGTDTIRFDIPPPGGPDSGLRTITLTSPLPVMNAGGAVIIDGWSQPGWSNRPLIEINGNNVAGDGFNITQGGSTVRGFIINRMNGDGIELSGAGGNTIVGNWIGLDNTGTLDAGNTGSGIRLIDVSGNVIGGTTAALRNVVSGNNLYGVYLQGDGADTNTVQGNYVGTNATGTAAVGNSDDGVLVELGDGNTIGGAAVGAGNLISGNGDEAIEIIDASGAGVANGNIVRGNLLGVNASATAVVGNVGHGVLLNLSVTNTTIDGNVIGGNAFGGVRLIGWGGGPAMSGNIVRGNWIGTNAGGVVNLGNGLEGIALQTGASNTTIGGTLAGEGNVIAYNGTFGLSVYGTSLNNAIRRNSIYGNGELGINLDAGFGGGVTPNDPGDVDAGANNLTNFPTITALVDLGGGNWRIDGTYNGLASTNVTLEFFTSPAADPSGFGEGRTYLGTTSVLTNGAGAATFSVFVTGIAATDAVTATATVANNTSEFSAAAGVFTVSGTVHHDVDGDADVVEAGTLAFANAVVRIYADDGDGVIEASDALVATTTTNAAGFYSFGALTNRTYWVTVDSTTLIAGYNAGFNGTWTWAEQTFGDDASTVPLTLSARYGGRGATTSDAAGTLLTSEHVARASVTSANVSGVDYGFSFNVVTNLSRTGAVGDVDDDGANPRSIQGSLHQFLLNANALSGANDMRFVPVVGTNQTGGSGNWWRLALSAALPSVTDAGTSIDGTAYAAAINGAVRDDHAGIAGYVGRVGLGADVTENTADDLTLAGVARAELEIVDANALATGLQLAGAATGSAIRDLAIYGFGTHDILVAADGVTVERNFIGLTAAGTDPGGVARTAGVGVQLNDADNASVQFNYIGYVGQGGVVLTNNSDNVRIERNEIRASGQANTGADGIDSFGSHTGLIIRGNRILDGGGPGIDTDVGMVNLLIEDNTVTNNSIGAGGEDFGIRVTDNATATVRRNVISLNVGPGLVVTDDNAPVNATVVRITQNAIYGNTGIGIDLDASGALVGGNGVTANDPGDADTGPNARQNFPVITQAVVAGTQLAVSGTLNSLAGESFVIELFRSAAGDPEGEVFIGTTTVTTDGAGNASFTNLLFSITATPGQLVTATATRVSTGATSEFSAATAITRGIIGTVYEDVNGDGNLADGVAVNGVTVRLYQDNGGTTGQVDATDGLVGPVVSANGIYVFGGLTNGATYWVAVDSTTIGASALYNGGFTQADVWAEQTSGSAGAVRFDGSFTYLATADAMFGGMRASQSDAATSAATAEHVTRVILGVNGRSGVDSGFSFNVVVNERGDNSDDNAAARQQQGTLRQFILNANAVAGGNSMRFVPATTPNVFGAALGGGDDWWRITVAGAALPTITDAATLIDGTAFAATVSGAARDDNAGALGTGGTVGVDGLVLAQVTRPELEIVDGGGFGVGIDVAASNSVVRDLAVHGFGTAGNAFTGNIRVAGAAVVNVTLENNYVGIAANALADPGPNERNGIVLDSADNLTIRNNLIGFVDYAGIEVRNGVTGSLIEANEIRGGGQANTTLDGINIVNSSALTIRGNLITANLGPGIDAIANASTITIENNSITNNGTAGANERFGIEFQDPGAGNLIDRNVISGNQGAGVLVSTTVVSSNVNAGTVRITRNSIFGNTGLGIDLDNTTGAPRDGDGFTANDALDADAGPNNLTNAPTLTTASLGANTTVAGTLLVPSGTRARIEFYSTPTADPSGYGEGQTYLGFVDVTDGGAGDTDGIANGTITFSATLPPVTNGHAVTATATRANAGFTVFTETSEFSNAIGTASISGRVWEDVNGDGSLADGVGVNGVNVRLYRDNPSAGTVGAPDTLDFLVGSTVITAGGGFYTFSSLFDAAYWVVVDSRSITPAAGTASATSIWAEQTYATAGAVSYSGTFSFAAGAGAFHGGMQTARSDDYTVLNALTATGAEHVTRATVSGANVTGVDSGYSFVAITNTRGDNADDDGGGTTRLQQGSLRQFILNSNNVNGVQTSNFSIGGGGAQTITVSGAQLDAMTAQVILDARTQEGYAGTPLIRIEGGAAPAGSNGLTLSGAGSSSSQIRGFMVTGFLTSAGSQGDGIVVTNSSNNVIAGNYVGTDGTLDLGNQGDGVDINGASTNNTVGGTTAADRNVISGNNQEGMEIRLGASANIVTGNYIGVAANGTTALANAANGIWIQGTANNVIGGSTAGARNVISGNSLAGVRVSAAGATGNTISGNYVGTNAAGTAAVGNGEQGILLASGANNTTIGGAAAGTGNVISGNTGVGIAVDAVSDATVQRNLVGRNAADTAALGNGGDGISLLNGATTALIGGTAGEGNVIAGNVGSGVSISGATTQGHRVVGNAIYANGGIGIDLGSDGVTANDAGDADTGANRLQNYPSLYAAGINGGNVTVHFGFTGTASRTFRVELFASTTMDGTGFGEGQRYLGFANVSTDAGGNATVSSITIAAPVAAGEFITATATDTTNDETSEFSNAIVAASRTLTGTLYNDVDGDADVAEGGTLTFAGTTVRLYADNGNGVIDAGDVLVGTTTTSGAGVYSFANLGQATYYVTVDSKTLAAPGYNASGFVGAAAADDVWAEQTYGDDWATTGVTLASRYGGRSVTASDNATALATAEHVAMIAVGGANVTGVDYGFSFSVIVDTQGDAVDEDGIAGTDRLQQGTLRQFILNSNAIAGAQTSEFQIGAVGSTQTITVTAVLPTLTDTVVLDAWTQGTAGYTGNPLIELNGTGTGATDDGLTLGGSGSTVRGFVINRFGDDGLVLAGTGGHFAYGNWIGLGTDGVTDRGNGDEGIYVLSANNTIGGTGTGQRNVISGNADDGIDIDGAAATGTVVRGNYVGTNAAGTAAVGNTWDGVIAWNGATGTVIDRNVISGNVHGIEINGGSGATITGNLIGLNAAGTADLGNSQNGVRATNTTNVTIGGALPAARNVISGNDLEGVVLTNADNSTIRGNYIGTNATGAAAVGNGWEGIQLAGGSSNVQILDNVLSGNGRAGIRADDAGTTGVIQGNLIGVNATGTAALGNGAGGIWIATGAGGFTIGGAVVGQGNVISGNTGIGIILNAAGGTTTIQGNLIGTTSAGTAALGNTQFGVSIEAGTTGTVVGGVGAGNVIAASGQSGIRLTDNSDGTVIRGNFIGTDATGTLNLGNLGHGIAIVGGAVVGSSPSGTIIGGELAGEGNVIAYNRQDGVSLSGAGVDTTRIVGNSIRDVDSDGNGDGIGIDLVGGTEAANGSTGNDGAGDADVGVNTLQNFPDLVSASTNGTQLTVTGNLVTFGPASYRIHVYATPAVGPTTDRQGATYLGFVDVTVPVGGNLVGWTTGPIATTTPIGARITVTASQIVLGNPTNTSELSGSIAVVAANTAPVNTVPATASVNEDVVLAFTGGNLISVADTQGNVTAVALSVTGGGALSVTLQPGATISAGTNGTASLTVSGTQAAINATLATLTYQGASNFNGSVTLTVTATDGGGLQDSDTCTITVNALNDAPTATNLSAGETYTEDTPLNLTDIVVSDIDSASVTVTLTLSNVAAGSLNTGTSGAVTSTYNAGTGVWTASGAIANVNTLLAGLTFTPAANFNASFNIGTSVSDGAAPALTGTKVMTGLAVNDAPTATNLSAGETYTEDTALNLTDIVVSDIDSVSVTVTLTLSNVTAGSLNTGTSGAVTSTYNAGTGVWTASGAIANVNTLLAGLTFTPAANFNASFNIGTSVSDAAAPALTGTKVMTGLAVNDAPTLGNGTLAAIAEDTASPAGESVATIFAGQFADIDSGASSSGIAVVGNTANAGTQGTWQYSTNAGTNWFAVGTVADNATALALSSTTLVRFVPVANYNGTPPALTVRGLDNTYVAGFSTTAGAETRVTINTATNGGSTAIAALTATLSTSVTAVNDAPVNSVPGAQATNEDTALVFSSGNGNLVSIADADAGVATVQVQLSVTNGTLTLSGTVGLTLVAGANGSATMTYQGSVSSLNTAMAGMSYTPTANYNGAAALTVVTSDLGNTGAGGTLTDTDVVAITVNAVNDSPAATNLSAPETYTEDTALDLTDIVVSDIDSASVTVTLTLSNVAAGSLNTGTSGAVTSTYNAGTGVWTASGAIANVNTLLAGLTFTPAANFNASFTIDTSVSDGVAAPLTGTKAMTGVAVNDAPTLAVTSTLNYTENQIATSINTGITVGDVDSATLASATVAISGNYANGEDVLGFVNGAGMGNIAGAWNAGTGTLTLTSLGATATLAEWQTALRAVTFVNTSDSPGTLARTIGFTVNDGTLVSNTVASTVNVAAVNDAPVLAANTGATVAEGGTVTLTGAMLTVTDADNTAAQRVYTVSSGPANGRLERSVAPGVAITSFTQADVDANLVRYVHDGSETTGGDFTFTVSDGAGGTLGATVFAITVTPVNDAPTLVVSGPRVTTENRAIQFWTVDGNGISIADIDAVANPVEITLTATNGTVVMASTAGLTPIAGANGSSTVTYQGTVAAINAALVQLAFRPTDFFTGAASLQVTVDDLGASGAGGPLSASTTIAITVNAAPTVNKLASAITIDGVASEGAWTSASTQTLDRTLFDNVTGSATWKAAWDATHLYVLVDVNDDVLQTPDGPQLFHDDVIELFVDGDYSRGGAMDGVNDYQFIFRWNASGGELEVGFLSPDLSTAGITFTMTTKGGGTGYVLEAAIPWARFTGALPADNANLGIDMHMADDDDGGFRDGKLAWSSVQADTAFTQPSVYGLVRLGGNTAPTGADNTVTTPEDTAYTFDAAAFGFSDADFGDILSAVRIDTLGLAPGATLRLSGVDVTAGQVILAGQVGNLVFTPAADANGAAYASFTFSVRDPSGAFDLAPNTMTIAVTAVNDAPVANADTGAVNEDATLTVSTANGVVRGTTGGSVADTDVDHATATLVVSGAVSGVGPVTQGAGVGSALVGVFGQLTLNADGSYTYVANNANALAAGATATDTFTYTVRDPASAVSNTATLVITVTGTNDAPLGVGDAGVVQEDGALTASGNVLANDSDVDTPAASLAVSEVNGLGANVGASVGGTYGSVTIGADGSYTYTLANASPLVQALAAGQTVTDVFSYRVADGAGGFALANLTITITGTNDAPVITSDGGGAAAALPVPENTTAVTTVVASDVDQAATIVYSLSGADAALFTINATTGMLAFVGAPNFEAPLDANADGIYQVTVQAADGLGGVDTQALSITVTDVNEPPVITSNGGGATAATSVAENTVGVTTVTAADVDAASVLTYAIVGGADNTLFSIDPNTGVLSFNAPPNFEVPADAGGNNVYDVIVRASDGTLFDDQAIAVTVTNVNEAPLAADDAAGVQEDVTLSATGNVLTNDTDVDAVDTKTVTEVDGAAGNVGLAVSGTYGSVTIDAAGNFTYLLNNAGVQALRAGQAVTDTFSYRMADGSGASSSANLVVTVTGTNDVPVAVDDAGSAQEDGTLLAVGDVLLNDSDVDAGTVLSVSEVNGVAGNVGNVVAGTYGTVTIGVNGSYTYTLANASPLVQALEAGQTVSDSFTYRVADGSGGSAVATLAITITGTNDAPTMSTGPGLAYTENQPATAIDPTLLVTDIDNGTLASATVAITGNFVSGEDALGFVNTVGMGNIVGSYNAGTGVLSLASAGATATVAQWQTALRAVTYFNSSDDPNVAPRTVTFTVNDGATDSSGAGTTVTITGAADAPSVTSGALATYNEAGPAVIADATVAIADADDTQLAGATIAITGGFTAGDQLAFTAGFGVTGAYNAATGVLTLTGVANLADYQTLLRSVTYGSTSSDPTAISANRTLTWQVTDANSDGLGAQVSAPVTSTVNITAVNNAPTLANGSVLAYIENQVAIPINTSIVVADPDNATLASATVAITGNFSATEDVLGFVNVGMGNIVGSYNAGTGVMSLASAGATATLAQWQAALRAVTYFNASDAPSAAARTVQFIIDDGAGASNPLTSTVTVTPVNDAPSVNVPGAQSVAEDSPLTFSVGGGNAVTVADVENDVLTVTLTAANGVLTLPSTTGLVFVTGTGAGDTTMTITGTVSDINAALDGLEFLPDLNYAGAGNVAIAVNDGGFTVSANVGVNVTPVNDAPVAAADGYVIAEDGTLVVGSATGLLANDSDIDGPATSAVLVAGPANGVLVLNADGSFTYTPNADFFGVDSFVYRASDGALQSAPTTVTITVDAVNDAPVNGAPASQMVAEDTPLVFSAAGGNSISVADVDAGSGSIRVTLSATNGAVTLSSTAGLVFQTGDGVNDATLAFTGTLADVNAALSALRFVGSANYHGLASLQLVSDDLGSSGSGGALTATSNIAITVTPINDAPELLNNTLTIDQGATVRLGAGNLSASDIDDASADLAFTVEDLANGRFERVGAPGVAVTQFTQGEVAAGGIQFVHTGSEAPTYRIRVADGSLTDGPRAATILFTPLGVPPTTGGGGGPIIVAPPELPSIVQPPLSKPPGLDVPDSENFVRPPSIPPVAETDPEPQMPVRDSLAETPRSGGVQSLDPKQLAAGEARVERFTPPEYALPIDDVVPVSLLPLTKAPIEIITRPAMLEMPGGGEERRLEIVLDSVRISGLALSVGAVWWALRAAGLVASLLASAPAWRHIDPLPVLGRGNDEDEEEDVEWGEPEDADAKRDEQAAGWVLEDHTTVMKDVR